MRHFRLGAAIAAAAMLMAVTLALAWPAAPAARALPPPASLVARIPPTRNLPATAPATVARRVSTATPLANEERVLLQGLGMI